jgi:small-conductance mechanosensitive channel/CRP-like cAMP-binding protein
VPKGSLVRAFLDRLDAHVEFILIAGGLVGLAYLINRFAPQKRRRIRRCVILFGAYLLAVIVASALHVAGFARVWRICHIAAELLEAFTAINLMAVALFDVALPRARIEVGALASDLVVGLAYVVSTIVVFVDEGYSPQSVLGASAVASAVFALSLQSTLGNILGGIAIQIDGSIHAGDWIALENGRQGKVKNIRWRHTAIETRDWDTIIVPNSSLLAQSFTILGRRTGQPPTHRMWVYFNVDFRYPPSHVIDAVTEALQAAPIQNVAADPKPHAICMDLAKDTRDSFAYYAVRYWLTDLAKDDPTSSAVRGRIYAALRRAGIPLARPTSTTFIAQNEDLDDKARLERMSQRRLEAVESLEIFQGLTAEEKEFLSHHLRYAPFTTGETMTRQGAVAHWLYILTAGKAEVRMHVDGKEVHVALVEAPGFFGEMGLMTGAPRTADVVALTDVECYRLDKDGFAKIITDRPEVVHQMSEVLAKRRVDLVSAQEGLDERAKQARREKEQAAILGRIRAFFGLNDGPTSRAPRSSVAPSR